MSSPSVVEFLLHIVRHLLNPDELVEQAVVVRDDPRVVQGLPCELQHRPGQLAHRPLSVH